MGYWVLGLGVLGFSGFWVLGFGVWVLGLGFQALVLGLGFWVFNYSSVDLQ